MKKLKFVLTSSAIILAVIAAFALRENIQNCTDIHQYYRDGSTYKSAGEFGVDYLCSASTDTCTFISDAGSYSPCHTGTHVSIPDKQRR